jgi:pSer/pThr/pTyr-binding forkhead associated (FHA) protein
MAKVTFQVVEGVEKGRVFRDLPTPVTLGREEGNLLRLNDERVSRFHAKVQQDDEDIILTDLESTNGTRVNGEDTQLRILRFGDVISVGRSVLLFGTRDQISHRLEELRNDGISETSELMAEELAKRVDSKSLSFELHIGASEDLQSTLHIPAPPDLPTQLSPGQAAQVSEILEYLHLRTRQLVQTAEIDEQQAKAAIPLMQWQELLDVQSQLAEYLRAIGDPEGE